LFGCQPRGGEKSGVFLFAAGEPRWDCGFDKFFGMGVRKGKTHHHVFTLSGLGKGRRREKEI